MDNSELLSLDSRTAQGSISSPNPVVTGIDGKLYKAAVEGNLKELMDVENMESLLTPQKNTILHIHITSTSPSLQFIIGVLKKCEALLLLPNAKGETLLHIAARYGHSAIAKLLIERAKALSNNQDIENGEIGAEKELIRATNSEGDTALHDAVRYHHIEVVKILLQMDPDYSYYPNHTNETPLYLASEGNYEDIMSEILEKVASPAYDGPSGRTALHAAVINRHLDMAKALVAKEHVRAAVKQADKEGWVPLHYAANMGDKELTQMLLEQDEKTAYMQDNKGRTAFHIAAYCGNVFIMDLIMKYRPDCSEIVNNKGLNVLHYAIRGNNWPAVEKIISNPWLSNIYNEKDKDGNTPLHHSVRISANLYPFPFKSHRLFKHRRLNKLAVNKENQTPLDVAYQALEDSSDRLDAQMTVHRLISVGAIQRKGLEKLKRKDEGEWSLSFTFTKEAKESHLLMTTLIATVTFAAGITLPGGTIQDGDGKGSPILGQRTSFKAFIVFNTLALVLAASAAFMHLFSPLSKSKWNDFYLCRMALSFTVVAIVAMILAFATATYAVLGTSSTGIAVITITLLIFLVFRQVVKVNYSIDPLVGFFIALCYIIGCLSNCLGTNLTFWYPIPKKNRRRRRITS